MAVFYSGIGAGEVAGAYAAEKGLMTISSTEGGAYLQSLDLYGLNSPVSRDEANVLWKYASRQYAGAASGDVTAILNNPDPERIYLSIERKILVDNVDVTLQEFTISEPFVPGGNFH